MTSDFAAFILTHGRPDNVATYNTLRKRGYTGRIVLVVDDLDKTRDQYLDRYGDEVLIFDKSEAAKITDSGDNFGEPWRSIIYARNASFKIARDLGIKYFVQLDDDYVQFQFRFSEQLEYSSNESYNLDACFESILRFYKTATRVESLAISQGGDFIGGSQSVKASKIFAMRKCMNSFFCSVDREFRFVGRINEDVNTYTSAASRGLLFLTTNQMSLVQKITQSNSGGMTDLYRDSGTYVKSFYSVVYAPSSVKISMIRGEANARIHHRVSWKNTVPMILRESVKK